MILKRLLTLTLIFGSLILTAQKMPFQGKLTENDEPVTGSRDFIFTFESVSWAETHEGVAVLDGFYSVVLGSINPIPDSLFDKSDQVQLSITVGETSLSSITVYAPFGAKTGRFVITETTDTSTVALNVYNNSTGTSFGTGSRIGAYIEAAGEGLNTGVFAYAENGRSINNQTQLTDPQAYVSGQLTSLYGYSEVGGRALQAQYTADGPGQGIGLSGFAGGGGVNWALWGRANSGVQATPSDTLQVGAYVEAYGPGSGEHTGLRGIASGENASRNIGVHGIAYNGINENWAGWFDGDVNVNGQFFVNGQNLAGTTQFTDTIESRDIKVLSPEGNLKAHLNYYEPNNAGSLVLYGGSDTTRTAILGSNGITGGNSGLLYLYDQFDQSKVQLRVDTLAGGADDFGALRLFNGDYSNMLYLDGSSGSGTFPGDLNVGGDILVNGQSITQTDSIVAKDIQLLDTAGRLKAHLNIFDTNAGSLVLNGANDTTKVILGSSNNGYDGALYLYDSLRNNGVQVISRNAGGRMQLAKYNNETEAFESAIVASSSNSNSFLSMYGQNSTTDGVTLMIDNYINANQIGVGTTDPLLNGYRRSGTDWKANDNRVYAAIGNAGTQSGDENGFSGYLSLWGTSTYNIELTGKRWQNNDLPTLALFGTNDDGNGWYSSNFRVDVDTANGNISYANLSMNNTSNGGGIVETVLFSSNFNGSGHSNLQMRDSAGVNAIELDAGSGGIRSLRSSDGGIAVDLFQNSENGGVSIQNSSNVNKLYYEASSGELQLSDDAGTATIDIQGNTGNIAVSGQVTAGGVALTSDKRYKRDIVTLDNALENTRKLRGTAYFWKDANKGTDRQIGVIAQEVEEVYPEFVHTNENGYKSVNYSQMVAVLIEAVKELDAKVTNLEEEKNDLKAELASKESNDIESLRSEIESIKRMLTSPAVEQSGTVGQDR